MSEQLSLAGLLPEPTDRVFFAIFPPVDVAERVAGLQARLCAKHRLVGKPLAADRLHITLCHLGDYAGLPRDVVSRAFVAGRMLVSQPFEVTFDSVGSFAGRPRNKPFVLRGGDGVVALAEFQRELCVGITRSGLGKWAKPYTPHMTLLYDNVEIAEEPIEPISWTVSEFVLVRSLLGKTQHIRLNAWPLGSAPES